MMLVVPVWATAGVIMLSFPNDRILLRSAQVALMLSLAYAMVSYYTLIHLALGGKKQILAHYYRIWDARAQRRAARKGFQDDAAALDSSVAKPPEVDASLSTTGTNNSELNYIYDKSNNSDESDDDDDFDNDYSATIGYSAREHLDTQGSFYTGNVIRAELLRRKHMKGSEADKLTTEDLILGDEDLWWATLGDLESDLSLKPGYVSSGLALLGEGKYSTNSSKLTTYYTTAPQQVSATAGVSKTDPTDNLTHASSASSAIPALEPSPFTPAQLLSHQVPPGYGTMHVPLHTNRDPRHYALCAAKGYCFRTFFACCCASVCLKGQKTDKDGNNRRRSRSRSEAPRKSLLFSAAPSHWQSSVYDDHYNSSSQSKNQGKYGTISSPENESDADGFFDYRGGLLPIGRWISRSPKALYRFHTVAAHQALIVAFIVTTVLVLLAVYRVDHQLVVVLLKSCLVVSLLVTALASHLLATIFAPSLTAADLGAKSQLAILVIVVAIQDVVLSCIANSGYLAPTVSDSGRVALRVSTFLLLGESVVALLIGLIWLRSNDGLVLKTSNDHLERMDYHLIILECQREADFHKALAEATGGVAGKDLPSTTPQDPEDDAEQSEIMQASKDMFLALSFQKSVGSRLFTGSSLSSTAQRSVWKAKARAKARAELLGEDASKNVETNSVMTNAAAAAAAMATRTLPREPYTNMGAVFQLFKFWDILPYIATDRSAFRTHPAPSREVLRRFYFDQVYRIAAARQSRLQKRQVLARERERERDREHEQTKDSMDLGQITHIPQQIETPRDGRHLIIDIGATNSPDPEISPPSSYAGSRQASPSPFNRPQSSPEANGAWADAQTSSRAGNGHSRTSSGPKEFDMTTFMQDELSQQAASISAATLSSATGASPPLQYVGTQTNSSTSEGVENSPAMLAYSRRTGVYDDDGESDAILLNLGNVLQEGR